VYSDFDFGVDTLVKYSNQCKFPWLMSNVNLSATHQPLASGLKTHFMEWNGVKIGAGPHHTRHDTTNDTTRHDTTRGLIG
jgi:2',3'-cyclic-nucleotide 2'-phosphodiesterase (5'-nucleotidase family)